MIVSRRSQALSAPQRQPVPESTFRLSAPGDALPMPEVEGVEHRFAGINGVHLHYAVAGRGEPLVLLHGWPQHWWAWRGVIPALAAEYRLICLDTRGFGWSEGGPEYAFEQLAADVVGLLDLLDIECARVVGHGWGAATGYHACLNWPGRFSHYVAIGGVAPWLGQALPARAHLRAWHTYALGLLGRVATTRLGVPENALRTWRYEGAFTPGETQVYLAPLRRPVSADATHRLYRHMLLHELPERIRASGSAALPVPTLHVRGEQDPLAGGSVNGSAGGARHTLIPDCGHFVAEERPGELVAGLGEFLA